MKKNITNAVIDRLYKFMDKNMTQYKLSQLSGIPYSTIKSIMQRKTENISFKTIILLSKGLNISPHEFVDDSFLADNLDIE